MGLGHSVPSESEGNTVDNEKRNERSMQPNVAKRVGKPTNAIDSDILTTDPHEIVLKFQKLQMDNIIEERNHSERIIREQEKLLKEKEETIRQQANLIKTQNELLGQRKQLRDMPNVGTPKSLHDLAHKARASKSLAKPSSSANSMASIENIHSNGQDHRNFVTANDDYETKYYDVEPYPSMCQEKPCQTYINSFQRGSRSSTVPLLSNHRASYNVRSSNSNGLLPTSSQQARRNQSNDCRSSNSKKEELSDYKESTDQLLADLEKQTNYEVQKLDHAQNGKRSLRPMNRTQCTFKCSGCRVARKHKTVPVGAAQKCKTCDNNNLVRRSCKSEDEGHNPNVWTSDSQVISDVD